MDLGQLTNQIGLIFALMLVGVLINKLGFMHPQTANDLTNILLYIVSPCLIVGAFEQDYSASRFHQLLLVTLGIIIFYIVEIILAKLIFNHVKDENLQRTVKYGSIYSNAGFMGVPLASTLFGNAGIFFAVASLAGFNIFSWTHGVSLFKTDNRSKTTGQTIREIVLNPNIIAIILGLILFIYSIQIPKPVHEVIHYVSSINTPLSMIVIGNSLGNIKLNRQLFNPHLWLAIVLRNVLFPMVAIIVLHLLSVSNVALFTTVVMAACPTAGLVVLFTLQAKGDTSPAVALMSTSTILSLVTIPIVFAMTQIPLF
ncbi:AEC family transporter [Lentilactobacillus sp. Marseille-Q4993]|uniref:AEC family transporter n=1 Tax=Lentilactobacillus sp. Marseille-Q4993 TaxID=3039492 RepID=UPI0024BCB52E|nr:AEC family transporter [Lentilactobacillus sp. Marseille-Q4993]